jgi:hypothetical protein
MIMMLAAAALYSPNQISLTDLISACIINITLAMMPCPVLHWTALHGDGT